MQIRQAGNAEAARMSANSLKNATRDQLIGFMSQVRNALLAGLAPKSQYDLCGFDFRDMTGSPYVAQDPTDLSAFFEWRQPGQVQGQQPCLLGHVRDLAAAG